MSSDEKALKPSERIRDIADGYVQNYPEAIMIFLDEQAELLDTHTEDAQKVVERTEQFFLIFITTAVAKAGKKAYAEGFEDGCKAH